MYVEMGGVDAFVRSFIHPCMHACIDMDMGMDTFEAGKEKEKGKKRFRQGICMEMDGWMTSSKGKGDI
jgi:hypothetical protein